MVKYKIIHKRFIITNDKPLKMPESLAEDRWGQAAEVKAKIKGKYQKKFLDDLSEWSDFPAD